MRHAGRAFTVCHGSLDNRADAYQFSVDQLCNAYLLPTDCPSNSFDKHLPLGKFVQILARPKLRCVCSMPAQLLAWEYKWPRCHALLSPALSLHSKRHAQPLTSRRVYATHKPLLNPFPPCSLDPSTNTLGSSRLHISLLVSINATRSNQSSHTSRTWQSKVNPNHYQEPEIIQNCSSPACYLLPYDSIPAQESKSTSVYKLPNCLVVASSSENGEGNSHQETGPGAGHLATPK